MRLFLLLWLAGVVRSAYAVEPWSEAAITEQSLQAHERTRAAADLALARSKVILNEATCRLLVDDVIIRRDRTHAVEAIIDEMVRHIIRVNRFPVDTLNLEVVFVDNRQFLAASVADLTNDGGSCHLIIISSGLLAMMRNDSQLAGVVSHELGHLILRGGQRHHESFDLPELAEDAASRLEESRADAVGVELAARAGYDPLGLAAVIADTYLLGPQAADHPAPAIRADTLGLLAKRAPAAEASPVRILGALRKLGY